MTIIVPRQMEVSVETSLVEFTRNDLTHIIIMIKIITILYLFNSLMINLRKIPTRFINYKAGNADQMFIDNR